MSNNVNGLTQITPEWSSSLTIYQGVSPEEPLQRYNRKRHCAQVQHRQRVFPPQKAGVEETTPWNHDPDKGCCDQRPRNVTRIVDIYVAGRVR
jgi:hypothetical protein